MKKRFIGRFCRDLLVRTLALLIALALYAVTGPCGHTDKEADRRSDEPRMSSIGDDKARMRESVRLSAYVVPDGLDDEPQLQPEEPEPQLPPEDLEPENIPEEPAYPVRDDLVDGKNVLDHDAQVAMQEACEKYAHVTYAMALAVCDVESDFDKDARSSTGDVGYMQINEINRATLAKLGYDIDDPIGNIWGGVCLLDGHMAATGDDVSKALMRYNNGAGGTAKLWRQGIYKTDYTKKVTKAIAKYEELLRS